MELGSQGKSRERVNWGDLISFSTPGAFFCFSRSSHSRLNPKATLTQS